MSFDLNLKLKNHKYFNNLEKANVHKVLSFLNCYERPYDRKNSFGHITAGAFVADKKGNILLNHHKKSNMWFQFGGHSDGCPDSLEVAKREVFEEAGIKKFDIYENSIFDVDVQTIPANETKGEPKHFHFDVNFLFLVNNKNFEISNESVEIKWVTIDEARILVHPEDNGMRRMIDKYEQIINRDNKKVGEKSVMENKKYGMAELLAEFGDGFENYKENRNKASGGVKWLVLELKKEEMYININLK